MTERAHSHTCNEQTQEEVSLSGANNRWRILYADDSERFRKTVAAFLRSCGYFVDEVEDGSQLINMLERVMNAGWQHDLIITDNEMPNVTGIRVLQYVRGNERTKHLPVIVFSGSDIKEAVEKAGGVFLGKDRRSELGALAKSMLGQARQPSQ